MKANAPEKIYLNQDDGLIWHCRSYKDDIEYIRADTFMEKAKKWFEEQNEWIDLDGNRQCDMESFEDFKNYMEGE